MQTKAQNLQEKMFEFASVEDSLEAKAELFLLEDGKFCSIRYTRKSNKVTGGLYHINNDSLYLTFIPRVVTLGVHGKMNFYLHQKKLKLPPLSFKLVNENLESLYGFLHEEALPVGKRISDREEEQLRLKSLREGSDWQVLQGKKKGDLKKEYKEEKRKNQRDSNRQSKSNDQLY
ncbi:hypothetical protein [Desertivirga arenae]|uniref:hypothetical protein n=1 Tax=Desertivirga arenae TaxID=2810309 RepID=UPI001A97C2EC|nr:hypothetical protein [Pedobacter sp. SYSU D00823]